MKEFFPPQDGVGLRIMIVGIVSLVVMILSFGGGMLLAQML